jgi:hypothetical protein
MEEVSALYHGLLDAWNRHDAAGYAALFADDGYAVGFDGSEMTGRDQIEQSLAAIFADHETGRYVGKVRTERVIQTLVAKCEEGRWRILQFQNTPAQFHGRPQDADALTNELRALV